MKKIQKRQFKKEDKKNIKNVKTDYTVQSLITQTLKDILK